ncbi:hypothetical protein D3C86_1428550 [compost metagenome]
MHSRPPPRHPPWPGPRSRASPGCNPESASTAASSPPSPSYCPRPACKAPARAPGTPVAWRARQTSASAPDHPGRRRVRPRSVLIAGRFAQTAAIGFAPHPDRSGSGDRANRCPTTATAGCCRAGRPGSLAPGCWAGSTRPAPARHSAPSATARCIHPPSRCCRPMPGTRPTAAAGCGYWRSAVAPKSVSVPNAG